MMPTIIQRLKRWHDQLVFHKEFQKGQRVLLYDSKLHIFLGKLKTRWIGPFAIQQVYSNRVVKLLNSNSTGSKNRAFRKACENFATLKSICENFVTLKEPCENFSKAVKNSQTNFALRKNCKI